MGKKIKEGDVIKLEEKKHRAIIEFNKKLDGCRQALDALSELFAHNTERLWAEVRQEFPETKGHSLRINKDGEKFTITILGNE